MSALGGLTPNPQTTLPGDNSIPTQYSNLPTSMSFGGAPLGAYTDSSYLADEAALRESISTQYQDMLQQLGYTDASGAMIPGRISTDAAIKQAQDEYERQKAVEEVTRAAQNNGTIFSGIRGMLQAQAEDPFIRDEAATQLAASRGQGDIYGQAQQLANQYNLGNNQLLAAAAARAAANITKSPSGVATDGGGPPPPTAAQTAFPTGTDPFGPATRLDPDPNAAAPAPDNAPVAVAGTPHPLTASRGDGTTGFQLPLVAPDISSPAPAYQIPTPPPIPLAAAGSAVGFAAGGEVTQPTSAVLGEQSSPGDRMSHEVVVPRYRLTPAQNKKLDKILDAAGIFTAAHGRLAAV